MDLEQTKKKWWTLLEAKKLILAENRVLKPMLSELKGDTLICFDELVEENGLSESHHQNVWYYSNELPSNKINNLILGGYEELALLSDSIDNFVLPHSLDFSETHQAILKEVWRCLVPEGRAIITGFNHYSLFGLPYFIREKIHQQTLSEFRLRQLLRAQGFVIEKFKTFYFRPRSLYNKENVLTQFIEILGNLFWPSMGCFYICVGKKPVLGISPMLETAKTKRAHMPKGIAEPTTYK